MMRHAWSSRSIELTISPPLRVFFDELVDPTGGAGQSAERVEVQRDIPPCRVLVDQLREISYEPVWSCRTEEIGQRETVLLHDHRVCSHPEPPGECQEAFDAGGAGGADADLSIDPPFAHLGHPP